MNIFYCYMEDTETEYKEAFEAASALQDELGLRMELTEADDLYSHWRVMDKYWGKDDLLVIERSVVVTKELITELVDCPYRVCTHYFKNSPVWLQDTISLGARINDPFFEYLFNIDASKEPPPFVTFSGAGFTKIGKEFQKKPLEPFRPMLRKPEDEDTGDYINCDNAIITNINSWLTLDNAMLAFHVHKKVRHLRSE